MQETIDESKSQSPEFQSANLKLERDTKNKLGTKIKSCRQKAAPDQRTQVDCMKLTHTK